MQVATVGLDLAKDVFQIHGISECGEVAFNRSIKRKELLKFFDRLPRFVVGVEACGSAHHWAREISKFGHDVRLIPAFHVKPCVKRGKTDAIYEEAICEAVRRPTMRFVKIQTVDQQAVFAVHRSQNLVIRQRAQFANMVRSVLREFGHVLPTRIEATLEFAQEFIDGDHADLP